MLFNCIRFASNMIISTDEQGRELKELCDNFKKIRPLLELYGLDNTRWYRRSETETHQVTKEEFFKT